MSKEPEKKAEAKAAPPAAPPAEPAVGPDGKLPPHLRKRRWGGAEYLETDFVRVTFLATGSLNGERFEKGASGDVPKVVFEKTLKPRGQAKLWEKPKPASIFKRPASDVGNFKRR